MPAIPNSSFEKKLYSMYLSYFPKEKMASDHKLNCDDRGSFTEPLKTTDHGQFSVTISKPRIKILSCGQTRFLIPTIRIHYLKKYNCSPTSFTGP